MINQSSPFISFVRKLIVFTIILAIVCFTVSYFLPIRWKTPTLAYLLIFFFSVNVVVHYFFLRASEKKFSRFVNHYMAGTTFKLMLYMTVLLLYVYLHRADALAFTVTFFVLYVLFTGFEIIALLNNKTQPENKNI